MTEDDIEYCRSLVIRPAKYYSAFISYSHENKPFAIRLHDRLQARGIRCWRDESDIEPGDRLVHAIDRAIRENERVLLLCSKSSLSSWWVGDELEKTLSKERETREDILIPLDLDGYLHKWGGPWASQVKARYAPSFVGWEDDDEVFEREVKKVVRALRTGDDGREDPPKSKL